MSKIRNLISNLPKWNRPPDGKYLNLKEWLIFCVGGCGAYGAGAFIQFFTLASGVYIAAALDINVLHITLIGVITSIATVLTSPLVSYLIDNTNTKFGKFRPYLIWLPIPIVLGFFALGQVVDKIDNYNFMIIAYTLLFNVVYFMNRIYTLCFNSIAQVISPSMEERTQIMSIGTFFTSLGPTLVGMLFPIIANFLYTEGKVSGVNNLKSFLWVIPVMAAVFYALGLIFAFGIKERMVLPRSFKQKQSFISGIRKTLHNKYFWITNISTVLGTFRIVATSFTMWIILYIIYPDMVGAGKEETAKFMQTIIVTLIGDACIPGMLFAPLLIRKFGKKNLIIFTSVMTTVCTIPMLFMSNPYALLVMIYLVTLFNGIQLVTGPAVQAEIYDFQQYQTGDRLEGFISQFGTMITTAIGIGFAFVTPAVYHKFGYYDATSVLYDRETLLGIIRMMCGIGVASGIFSVIPYFFYNLNEKLHKKIMQILKVRANCKDGLCDEEIANDLENRIKNGEEDVLKYFDKNKEENTETI